MPHMSKHPNELQNEIKCTKDEVQEQKNTTQLILSAAHELAKKMECNTAGINDNAISKREKANDKQTSEPTQSVATATDKVKTIVEQKSCKIINTTITILDNVQTHNDNTTSDNPRSFNTPGQKGKKVSKSQTQTDTHPKKKTQTNTNQ